MAKPGPTFRDPVLESALSSVVTSTVAPVGVLVSRYPLTRDAVPERETPQSETEPSMTWACAWQLIAKKLNPMMRIDGFFMN